MVTKDLQNNQQEVQCQADVSDKMSSETQIAINHELENSMDATNKVAESSSKSPVAHSSRGKCEQVDDSGQPGEQSRLPTIKVTPPSEDSVSNQRDFREGDSQSTESLTDGTSEKTISQTSGGVPNGSVVECQTSEVPESPLSEEELSSSEVRPNQTYPLIPRSDMIGNSFSGPDRATREDGRRESRSSKCGSLESLVSQDWDIVSERMTGTEIPSRVFNSPYSSLSNEYHQVTRISEYNGRVSPATSEASLFSLNSRSSSPVCSPTVFTPRGSYTVYKTLTRKQEVIPNGLPLRTGNHSKRDYIKELTGQLDESQRRNKFLEAESIQMDKERCQLRYEMRGLLVRNEDLLQINNQLQGEMRMMMERMAELEGEKSGMSTHIRQLETELTEAREMMVEANTQECAFNYLQQSLKSKLQDAGEILEKQTQDSQSLSEKLWQAERKIEELNIDKQAQAQKTIELENTMLHLEAELGLALQTSGQTAAELSLHRDLHDNTERTVEKMEESLMEKTKELQRAQQTLTRLQGEVSEKMTDKEQALEKEIQQRERAQLQCKQAERTARDMQAELQTLILLKEDLAKQLKQAQENIVNLESNVEDIHDNEQRWANKHKRAIDQLQELQKKLIQEKDLNDQLESEKGKLERQMRDLRMEAQELQDSRVHNDMAAKAELKVKELEDTLQTEARSKTFLVNTVGKLERKLKQLSDQMEEEQQATIQQTTQMTQRIRSLKRQLNEADEEASRKETQQRQTQRELQEERDITARLQRQLTDLPLQIKQKESLIARQTLTSQKRMVSC
ncbi:hypothetical protein AAFF_G00426050 [Aldrovandia affinis]|uniref:Myosin tail domain-containing protein n=1 Tax=Aldrovandia affinis TaxID=143900 RepID=A0AAD7T759_9TELE|nr:hypothetical protein AAFF_G00426050 [Aldrovandia affinis]